MVVFNRRVANCYSNFLTNDQVICILEEKKLSVYDKASDRLRFVLHSLPIAGYQPIVL
jgi:hypothetical protein